MNNASLLSKMSLEEKVGQMFLLAFAGKRLGEARIMLQKHYIGGCYISQENAVTPEEALKLSTALQGFAKDTPHGIPLLLGADQEGTWGVLVPYSSTGPGNLALGATQNPEMTRQMYQVIGEELSAVGYNAVFAPCADVNSNPSNPIIGMRSFGEDPKKVAEHVAAAVSGACTGGIITTAKHFPGHGDTSQDSHRSLSKVDRTRSELDEIDLFPFNAAIRAGVDIIMTSHILFPALDSEYPATLSKTILQKLLRQEMGFTGVILSDSMNMGAMRKHYPPDESAVMAVLAGVDMIMLAEEHYDHDASLYLEKQLVTLRGVLNAVKQGRIPMECIDAAAGRILELKERSGLFTQPAPSSEALPLIGNAAHREVETTVAGAAVTLIRDTSHLWPLSKEEPFVLINATPLPAYEILTQTRGIGPNQNQPAFEAFKDALLARNAEVTFFRYEQIQGLSSLPKLILDAKLVLVVTEDYTLPGVDFDTASQKMLVKRLSEHIGDRMIVIGLRTPYELAEYPNVSTYVCTFSSRPCAAIAAARAALGQIVTKGQAPVSVPV